MHNHKRPERRYLFIEGTSNEENGKLAQGFHKLLVQKLKGKMPRIKMADGKSQAIKTFKKSTLSKSKFLLIDLDAPEGEKENKLKENDLQADSHRCFFMIQEMEAWFLSQPEILDEHFGDKISSKITRPAIEIPKPKAFLKKITRGEYHNVEDGTALLQMLDAQKLMKTFNDFSELINKLQQ